MATLLHQTLPGRLGMVHARLTLEAWASKRSSMARHAAAVSTRPEAIIMIARISVRTGSPQARDERKHRSAKSMVILLGQSSQDDERRGAESHEKRNGEDGAGYTGSIQLHWWSSNYTRLRHWLGHRSAGPHTQSTTVQSMTSHPGRRDYNDRVVSADHDATRNPVGSDVRGAPGGSPCDDRAQHHATRRRACRSRGWSTRASPRATRPRRRRDASHGLALGRSACRAATQDPALV